MRIFWDTNLFIYLWEESPRRDEMRAFSRVIIEGGHTVVTSALTVAEILVRPVLRGNSELQASYLGAFRQIPLIPFDLTSAQQFAHLRAANPGLRAPDAIQLACASVARVDLFVTNDVRLSDLSAPGIPRILPLADWSRVLS